MPVTVRRKRTASRGHPRRRARAAAAACFALLLVPPSLTAQRSAGSAPADTFADPAVRALFARARAARYRDLQGVRSYEGTLREHMYVGLTAFRFRRERGLFQQERVARLRWSADGARAIEWLAARRAIPIIGADTRRDDVVRVQVDSSRVQISAAGKSAEEDMRKELSQDLLRESSIPNFALDPSGERLHFGGNWALNPLSDSAGSAYRYASGDTLRIGLPGMENAVVLYEIKVQPRRADFHLVAGSLWFDASTASLVRATYKPARTFDLAMDEPDDAKDVPGFLKPVQADIYYITVEYGLYDMKYWLPRRFALEGEVRMGRLLRMPLTLDWSVRDYTVNDTSTEIHVADALPDGWARKEQHVKDSRGERHPVTVVVPPEDELLHSPELSASFGRRAATAFTDAELNQLKGELQALLPTYRRFRPSFAWGLQRGMVRYNRVEGLSVGGAATIPFTPATSADLEARVGTGDHEPGVSLSLRHGTEAKHWTLSGYHRLAAMGDWGTPFSFTSSLSGLVLGTDREEYFRVTGASLGFRSSGDRVKWEAAAFHERERPVSRKATFYLLESMRHDTVPGVLPAERLDLTGGRLSLSWFSGIDPAGLIVSGKLVAEAAGGDATYQRAAITLSASHPLPLGLAGAVEVGTGALWGDEPIQRDFFLGGSASLRGFNANELHGTSFWRGRAELATGFAGARAGIFSDVAWVGPRDQFGFSDPKVSVGLGTSFLDGLFRADLSRAVRGGSRWKVNLYLDGLF